MKFPTRKAPGSMTFFTFIFLGQPNVHNTEYRIRIPLLKIETELNNVFRTKGTNFRYFVIWLHCQQTLRACFFPVIGVAKMNLYVLWNYRFFHPVNANGNKRREKFKLHNNHFGDPISTFISRKITFILGIKTTFTFTFVVPFTCLSSFFQILWFAYPEYIFHENTQVHVHYYVHV